MNGSLLGATLLYWPHDHGLLVETIAFVGREDDEEVEVRDAALHHILMQAWQGWSIRRRPRERTKRVMPFVLSGGRRRDSNFNTQSSHEVSKTTEGLYTRPIIMSTTDRARHHPPRASASFALVV